MYEKAIGSEQPFHAGGYKYLTMCSWALSAVSALVALLPFIYIWRMIEEALRVAPDFSQAQSLAHNGWMAVLFAVSSYQYDKPTHSGSRTSERPPHFLPQWSSCLLPR